MGSLITLTELLRASTPLLVHGIFLSHINFVTKNIGQSSKLATELKTALLKIYYPKKKG